MSNRNIAEGESAGGAVPRIAGVLFGVNERGDRDVS